WVSDQARRLVITNHHVVRDFDMVEAIFPAYRDGRVIADRAYYDQVARKYRGKVIHSQPSRDLALIQVEALPPGTVELKLAPESAQPADSTFGLGNPGASEGYWISTIGSVRQV